jgi:hypothetical protein
MLSLDIPFQLLIFVLYSFIGDAVAGAGVDISIGSRLFCGASSGMVSLCVFVFVFVLVFVCVCPLFSSRYLISTYLYLSIKSLYP